MTQSLHSGETWRRGEGRRGPPDTPRGGEHVSFLLRLIEAHRGSDPAETLHTPTSGARHLQNRRPALFRSTGLCGTQEDGGSVPG